MSFYPGIHTLPLLVSLWAVLFLDFLSHFVISNNCMLEQTEVMLYFNIILGLIVQVHWSIVCVWKLNIEGVVGEGPEQFF